MKYILIVMWYTSAGGSIQSSAVAMQEFDTRFACEFAKEHIISVKKPPHAFCLAKGTP